MRLLIGNTTRFFTVVGAPYVPERHFDIGSDFEPRAIPPAGYRTGAADQDDSTGWWLQDEC